MTQEALSKEAEEMEFLNRCRSIERGFKLLEAVETSPRVWMSVMTVFMSHICAHEKNPQGAIDQVINGIKSTTEKMLKERNETKAPVNPAC